MYDSDEAAEALQRLLLGRVTGGPTVLTLLREALQAAYTAGYTDGHAPCHAAVDRAVAMTGDAVAKVNAYVHAEAARDPKLSMIARELRARGWRPPAGFSCGCNPAEGLCPTHAAVRAHETVAAGRA